MRTLQVLEDENHQLVSQHQQVVNKLNEVSTDLDEFKRFELLIDMVVKRVFIVTAENDQKYKRKL